MSRVSPVRHWVSLAVGLLLIASVAATNIYRQPVGATHQPADKVVAAGSTVEEFGPGDDVTLASATLRTSSPTDLIFNVTLECSILTKLRTAGSDMGGAVSSDTQEGTVRVWVEVVGRGIVPINSSSAPPQAGSTPNSGGDADKVTFCNRAYHRTVEDAEDDDDGVDEIRDYIDTKSANAFNWVLLNAGSGVHTFLLKAEFTASDTPLTCTRTTGPDSCSTALVGNRILIIQPAKLANDASV